MMDVLERFSPATAEWFRGAFREPTAAQAGAWDAISTGQHALVIAPTGSGKTLASFLWSIDRLISASDTPPAKQRTRVLYVSPLKALGVDVERNLRSPLVGITQTAKRLGLERQWLHAMRLGFEHPETGDYVTYESTYPDDLAHALEVIRDEH